MDHSHLHARARSKGVNPIVYWLMRAWLQPFAHLYWRLSRIGREHVPTEGPVIFVSNHRSFIDPFILGLCNRRPVYYVAKEELFRTRALGWFLSSLGAFPVRRGAADADMIETAKAVDNLDEILSVEGLDAIYIDLPLDTPATALVADHLERLGVSYSGIFPNSRADGDVLRMQSLHRVRVKADDVAVASDHGRELLDYVLADMERRD